MQHVAVIDVGKTNAKLLLIDLASGREVAVFKTANRVLPGPPYAHFDVEGLWTFLIASLANLAAGHRVDAISITTHGASAVLVAADGTLALPMLDYEDPGPDTVQADYDAVRPGFAETGSARLPGGLNLGAQLYWQARRFPDAFARVAQVLTYPQYWAWRLTGVAASEVTSLGCHTDLWNPWLARFSSLVERQGWAGLFPPVRPAAARLGGLLPEIAAQVGLSPDVPVFCGIHDSNASLLPYLGAAGAFSVVSSGTWMINMAVGGRQVALDPGRDVLVNVNAKGGAVPTARYMGGREFEALTAGRIVASEPADLARVLAERVMVLPSLHPETGPFPGLRLGWTAEPGNDGMRCAAAACYVALMVAECLDLIAAEGPIHVEGPFGGNPVFAAMLATATGREVLAHGQSAGTGLGAALLAGPLAAPAGEPVPVRPDPALQSYALDWQARVRAAWAGAQGR